jgi:hypothetical protein
MPYTPDLLSLHLWDLRAQMEGQLRRITQIQRLCEKLSPAGDPRRFQDRRRMASEMADVLTTSAAVRAIAAEALDIINAIPD